MNDDINILIETTEDFAPSPRLRAALDALAEAVASSSDEVSGFTMGGLTLGTSTIAPGTDKGWRDGCWGYSFGGGTMSCGWMQFGGASCKVYHS